MARCDDEVWLFVGMVLIVVGILVSDMSSEAEVEKNWSYQSPFQLLLVH